MNIACIVVMKTSFFNNLPCPRLGIEELMSIHKDITDAMALDLCLCSMYYIDSKNRTYITESDTLLCIYVQ